MTEAHPESVNARLAEFFKANQEAMTEDWMTRVLADPAIQTGSIETADLKRHLPVLFADLTQALRFYGSDAVAQRGGRDAARLGARRWRQGFDLTELLREIAHLRMVFVYQLRIFEELNEDFGMAARLFASTTVNRFLDDLVTAAADEFVRADKAEAA